MTKDERMLREFIKALLWFCIGAGFGYFWHFLATGGY